jgi:hypothetical protein
MPDKPTTITLTLSLDYAQVILDCLDNDIELSSSNYTNFRDVGEMKYFLRRAELFADLQQAVQEAAAEDTSEEEAA